MLTGDLRPLITSISSKSSGRLAASAVLVPPSPFIVVKPLLAALPIALSKVELALRMRTPPAVVNIVTTISKVMTRDLRAVIPTSFLSSQTRATYCVPNPGCQVSYLQEHIILQPGLFGVLRYLLLEPL
jgi:hypothetical protein